MVNSLILIISIIVCYKISLWLIDFVKAFKNLPPHYPSDSERTVKIKKRKLQHKPITIYSSTYIKKPDLFFNEKDLF